MPAGCFAVGRLDRETTGLLLCTSDGDLANAVLRPDHETTKTYWLWLDEAISDDDPRLTRLTEGLLHNGQLLSAKRARVLARSEHATELELTLTQGKNGRSGTCAARSTCTSCICTAARSARSATPASPSAAGVYSVQPKSKLCGKPVGGRHDLRQRKVLALARQASAARDGGRCARAPRGLARARGD